MVNGIYRFGDYQVSPAARELHFRGELVVMSPKVFDCLAYLIEHRGRAVGRDELISAVWGKLDVSDTLLGQTILKARRAVGDAGNEQHAIRTVPRFGYRWIAQVAAEPAAPVSELDSNGASNADILRSPAEAWPASPKIAKPRRSRRRILAAALIAFAAIGWLVYTMLPQRAPN